MIRSFWIIVLLSLFTGALAGNYYVAKNGNDGNSGGASAPWLTIQHAVDNVSAGDTIWVREGVYNELVTFNRSGSESGGYITLLATPGEAVVIDGTGLENSGSWIPALVKIINKSYLRVEGFELRNLVVNSSNLFPAGIWVRGSSHHLELKNNVVHDIRQNHADAGAHGIAVYGTSAVSPLHDILIHGNEIYHCKLGWSESLVLNGNVTDFVVCHNVVHDNDNIGFDFIGHEGECPDPAQDQARNGQVFENVAYNIDSRNNPAYGGEASADGFYVDGGKDIVLERNTVYQCNIGFEVASEHGGKSTSGILVRNNYIYHNHVVGIAMGGYDSQRGSTENCTFVNNTLYQNNTDRLGWGAEILVQYYCRNVVVKNNLIVGTSGTPLVDNSTGTGSNQQFDYNLYYSNGTPRWYWKNGSYTSLAAYQSGSGQEAHSLYDDPLLQQPDVGDPALTAGSPAIDQGELLGSDILGTLDYYVNPRVVNGTVDLGSCEFQGSSTGAIPENVRLPRRFRLVGSFPNPFNPRTTVVFELPRSEQIRLQVYDNLGERVRELANQRMAAGYHRVVWDGRDDFGNACPSGVYFLRLTGSGAAVLKVILLR